MAAVTPAGTGTNQTDAVVFAADDYHQIAGSGAMTIDHGAVDAFSGMTDIDGQSRTIGQAPDIGADELAFPTTTALSCNPNPLQVGMGPTRCDVTVTDASSPPPAKFLSGVRPASDLPGTIESSCEQLLKTSPYAGNVFFPLHASARRRPDGQCHVPRRCQSRLQSGHRVTAGDPGRDRSGNAIRGEEEVQAQEAQALRVGGKEEEVQEEEAALSSTAVA